MADWLSRAITVNAIEEEKGEPSRNAQQFLREWKPEEQGEHNVMESYDGGDSPEEERPAEEMQTDLEEIDEIINLYVFFTNGYVQTERGNLAYHQ